MERPRLGILLSGGGTTAEAIIKATQSGELPIDVACVISNNRSAGGLEKARALHIPKTDIVVLGRRSFKDAKGNFDEKAYGEALLQELTDRKVTVVTQNGWMVHTPENVINAYSGHIFNQHPGPVPEFGGQDMYGMRVHEAVRRFFEAVGRKDSWTEAVGQFVHPFYDEGPVVRSVQIEIFPNDTAESIQKRVLPREHENQIAMLKDYASGRLQVVQRPSLVRLGEEAILKRVKEEAIIAYPHG